MIWPKMFPPLCRFLTLKLVFFFILQKIIKVLVLLTSTVGHYKYITFSMAKSFAWFMAKFCSMVVYITFSVFISRIICGLCVFSIWWQGNKVVLHSGLKSKQRVQFRKIKQRFVSKMPFVYYLFTNLQIHNMANLLPGSLCNEIRYFVHSDKRVWGNIWWLICIKILI